MQMGDLPKEVKNKERCSHPTVATLRAIAITSPACTTLAHTPGALSSGRSASPRHPPPQVLISTLLYFAFTAWGYALVVSGCLLCVFVVQAHAYTRTLNYTFVGLASGGGFLVETRCRDKQTGEKQGDPGFHSWLT